MYSPHPDPDFEDDESEMEVYNPTTIQVPKKQKAFKDVKVRQPKSPMKNSPRRSKKNSEGESSGSSIASPMLNGDHSRQTQQTTLDLSDSDPELSGRRRNSKMQVVNENGYTVPDVTQQEHAGILVSELTASTLSLSRIGHRGSKADIRGSKGNLEESGVLLDPSGIPLKPIQEMEYPPGFRVYKRRWFVLFVASLLNCSNAMSWIGYAPVANYVDKYYKYPGTANYLSMLFLIAAVPVAFVSMWSVRRFGLRLAILLAGWANGIGAALRLLSNIPGIPSTLSLVLVLGGQCIAACAYPFIMFLPTKIAAAWFPGSQRALATSLATLANPLGVLLANLISPQLVTKVWMVMLLNLITFIPSATACILATIGIRTSSPPRPPTASAAQESLPYLQGIKKCLKSRAYILLFVCLGGGIGMFNALYSVMQQLLCPKGYENGFAGLCCVLMVLGGLIGATVSGIIVDRTKKFEVTMKIAFALGVVFGVVVAQVTMWPLIKPLIAICCFMFGVFGIAAYPIGLELGAECTFPVAETTSTGLIVLSGQIQGVLYIILFASLAKPMDPAFSQLEVCSISTDDVLETPGEETAKVVEPQDMTLPLLIFSSIGALMAIVFTIFFRPKLRRLNLEVEQKKAVEKAEAVPTSAPPLPPKDPVKPVAKPVVESNPPESNIEKEKPIEAAEEKLEEQVVNEDPDKTRNEEPLHESRPTDHKESIISQIYYDAREDLEDENYDNEALVTRT